VAAKAQPSSCAFVFAFRTLRGLAKKVEGEESKHQTSLSHFE